MCGIVYAQSFMGLPVNNAVLDQYDKQKTRGMEGFGVYDGEYLNMVHTTTEDKILKWLCKYDSNLLLMHHRYPTSTINVKRAAHPFSTKGHFGDTEYILVHNGVMRNHNDLFDEHQEQGIDYQSLLDDWTFNDSEALLWDFALTMEGKQDAMHSIGRIAFVCLKKEKGKLTTLYFGRNSSPLNMDLDDEGLMLSSEGPGTSIKAQTLYAFDYQTRELTEKLMEFREYPAVQAHDTHYRGSWNDEYDEYGGRYPDSYTSYESPTWDDDDDDVVVSDVDDEDESGWGTLRSTLRTAVKEVLTSRRQVELIDEDDLEEVIVSEKVIQDTAYDYLAMSQGNFETAYWYAEADYDEISDWNDSYANRQYARLLECVMEYIDNDPEFRDEKSTSSYWAENRR
jgi:asparagine synthetase B (glutamine-hydrolysing)